MITQPTDPKMIDAFIVDFNTAIQAALPWLNNPLGKIQPITKDGKLTPAMHKDAGEYIEVFPNDKFGNFSWFDVDNMEPIGKTKFKASCRFNMFLDLSIIYPLITDSRNLENVKSETFNALKTLYFSAGAIRINSISEKYSDVYLGYALPDLHDKYFMQPYAGLSFNLDLYILNTAVICLLQPGLGYNVFRSTDVPNADYVPIGSDTVIL